MVNGNSRYEFLYVNLARSGANYAVCKQGPAPLTAPSSIPPSSHPILPHPPKLPGNSGGFVRGPRPPRASPALPPSSVGVVEGTRRGRLERREVCLPPPLSPVSCFLVPESFSVCSSGSPKAPSCALFVCPSMRMKPVRGNITAGCTLQLPRLIVLETGSSVARLLYCQALKYGLPLFPQSPTTKGRGRRKR